MESAHALNAIFSHLAQASWQFVALGLALQLLELAAGGRAWQLLLRGLHRHTSVRYLPVLGSYLAGVGASVLLPARGGELPRLFLARRRIEGSSYGSLTLTLALEGTVDVLLFAPILLAAVWLGLPPPGWSLPGWPLLTAAGFAFATALLLVPLCLRRSRQPLASRLRRLREQAAPLSSDRRLLLAVLGWHALGWALRLLVVYAFLLAFAIPASPRTVLIVVSIQVVSGLVPFAPGGAGAQQPLLVLALAGTASPAAALAFGIGFQAITTLADAILGAAATCLMLRMFPWRRQIPADLAPDSSVASATLG